jgi:hypothetical protein
MMMEAARTSETSVDIQLRTRQYIPEDSELHTRRRENLKFHFMAPQLTKWSLVFRDKSIASQLVRNLPPVTEL